MCVYVFVYVCVYECVFTCVSMCVCVSVCLWRQVGAVRSTTEKAIGISEPCKLDSRN